MGRIFARVALLDLPLGEFVRGLGYVAGHSRFGHPAYLAGMYSDHGWPYYFFVTTGLKVPIATFLALALTLGLAIRARATTAGREVLLLGAISASILLAAAPGGINIGHRHVLAVEMLFALAVAGGVRLALDEPRPKSRRIFLLLLSTAIMTSSLVSVRAHPDYLGYTNALAGTHPDRWLADSNLDWGQDLDRLRLFLADRGIQPQDLHLAYFGTADPARHGLAGVHALEPYSVAEGWIAISVTTLRSVYLASPHDQYGWLLSLPEAGRIGTSIRLYHVQPGEAEALRHRLRKTTE
jgi:hypothetical protein